MSIPKGLIDAIPEDESILYISGNLNNKKVKRNRVLIYVITLIMVMIVYYSITLPDFLRDFSTPMMDPINLIIVFVPMIFFMMALFLTKFLWDAYRYEKYFLITERQILIYEYKPLSKKQSLEKIMLTSILGLKSDKKRFFNKMRAGNLEIVHGYRKLSKLKHIPAFKKFQILLESILYHFGNIEKKWSNLVSELNLKFPVKIENSNKKIDKVEWVAKIRTYLIIVISVTCGIIMTTVIALVNLEASSSNPDTELMMYYYMAIVFTPSIGLAFILIMMYERMKMKRRCSPKNSILFLKKDQILSESDDASHRISLSKFLTLSYLKIQNPMQSGIKWTQKAKGILIRPTFDFKDEFMFGPFEKFPQNFSIFFYYVLVWKSEQGFLINKEELLENQTKPNQLNSFKSKKSVFYDEISSKPKKRFDFVPIELSNQEKEIFQKVLNPEERIHLRYNPTFNLKKNIIFLIIWANILIGSLSLLLIAFTGLLLGKIYIPFPMISIPILFFLMVISPIYIINQSASMKVKRMHEDDLFLFSTEKVLMQYRKEYMALSYEQIRTIVKSKKRFSHETYNIKMILYQPIKFGGFLDIVFSIDIDNVPNESPLIEKIRYLKQNI